MINRLIESGQPVEVQDTTFTTDVWVVMCAAHGMKPSTTAE